MKAIYGDKEQKKSFKPALSKYENWLHKSSGVDAASCLALDKTKLNTAH